MNMIFEYAHKVFCQQQKSVHDSVHISEEFANTVYESKQKLSNRKCAVSIKTHALIKIIICHPNQRNSSILRKKFLLKLS